MCAVTGNTNRMATSKYQPWKSRWRRGTVFFFMIYLVSFVVDYCLTSCCLHTTVNSAQTFCWVAKQIKICAPIRCRWIMDNGFVCRYFCHVALNNHLTWSAKSRTLSCWLVLRKKDWKSRQLCPIHSGLVDRIHQSYLLHTSSSFLLPLLHLIMVLNVSGLLLLQVHYSFLDL